MRILSPAALTKVASKFGNEPINIVEVIWTPKGSSSWYADRPVFTIPGKILEIGQLDDVVSISTNLGKTGSASSEITVKLDDTDGTIKDILNQHDPHLQIARVWQYFSGLAFTDKFLVLSGLVNSPVEWNEHDRTVSFSIVSRLEDKEVGFSAEEGDFGWVPKELVGKAWPMPFGTPLDYPALSVSKALRGITTQGLGIISGTQYINTWVQLNSQVIENVLDSDNPPSTAQAQAQSGFLLTCALDYERAGGRTTNEKASAAYFKKATDLLKQQNDLDTKTSEQLAKWADEQKCRAQQKLNAQKAADCRAAQKLLEVTNVIPTGLGPDSLQILGGEDFPQNIIVTLNIGGGYFTGQFHGDIFYITNRFHPENEIEAAKKVQTLQNDLTDTCQEVEACPKTGTGASWKFQMEVPCGSKFLDFPPCNIEEEGGSEAAIPDSNTHQSKTHGTGQSYEPIHFWADAGSDVTMETNIAYIVSIIPGLVLSVRAFYKPQGGLRQLTNVPTDLYTVITVNYGTITSVQVITKSLLSSLTVADGTSQGWEDDLYITFQSSIGPNIIDILVYLINNYTTLTYDTASFNYVKTKLQPFPANFPILDKKNILTVLDEISFQARCALWIKDGVFFIKYLAEEPTADSTITLSDIDFESGLQIELTRTEDIITRYDAIWHLTWAPMPIGYTAVGGEQKIILRHNVAKYGLKKEEYDFYIYNQPDIVYKVATFWLIRKSNTWKKIKFSTFLQKLELETLDAALLNFGDRNYAANSPIKAVIEKAAYNSDKNTVDFECLLPVKAGTMVQYPFFWPANLPLSMTFPTAEEIAEGWAGGNGIGIGARGDLPVGYIPNQPGTIFIGGINIGFGPHSDWGDRTPTDAGFVARSIGGIITSSNIIASTRPNINLSLSAINPQSITLIPYSEFKLPAIPIGLTSIDIRTTLVSDSDKHQYTTLDTFFKDVSSDGYLLGDTEAYWGNTDHDDTGAKQFDFKFDDEGDQFGAGTAFLKD